MAVVRLERIRDDMRRYLEAALDVDKTAQPRPNSESVNLDPKEPQNWPHITTTNQLQNPKEPVIASKQGSRPAPEPTRLVPSAAEPTGRQHAQPGHATQHDGRKSRTDSEPLLKITPAELVNLAPRLKTYLGNDPPRWPEIVDAADWLRDELGISKFIWGDACITMGREQAAIAVAIVSTKPPRHFRASAGAYFHGMVSRAKLGELHLTRAIWGMRSHSKRGHSVGCQIENAVGEGFEKLHHAALLGRRTLSCRRRPAVEAA
jgi:replication initiation protein RepC